MSSGTTINLSVRSRNILAGLKEKKDHKNFDSALREVFMRSDIDEEELIEFAEEEGVYKDPNLDSEERERGVYKESDQDSEESGTDADDSADDSYEGWVEEKFGG